MLLVTPMSPTYRCDTYGCGPVFVSELEVAALVCDAAEVVQHVAFRLKSLLIYLLLCYTCNRRRYMWTLILLLKNGHIYVTNIQNAWNDVQCFDKCDKSCYDKHCAPTNGRHHITSNIVCAHSQQYTKNADFWLAQMVLNFPPLSD